MKRGCQKRQNAKFQLNPITSHFVLFSIPEEIAMHVTGRKFSNFSKLKFSNIFFFFAKWSLGMKRGCQKRQNAKFQLNPITSHFVLFSIPEEIAMHVTGREFSIFQNKILNIKFFKILIFFLQDGVWE